MKFILSNKKNSKKQIEKRITHFSPIKRTTSFYSCVHANPNTTQSNATQHNRNPIYSPKLIHTDEVDNSEVESKNERKKERKTKKIGMSKVTVQQSNKIHNFKNKSHKN